MQEFLGTVLTLAIIFGVITLVRDASEEQYTPPAPSQVVSNAATTKPATTSAKSATETATNKQLPLKCAIVMSASDRQRGKGIPGLNGAAGPLPLLRPVGEMLAAELPAAAKQFFREVELVSSTDRAHDADVVIVPGEWVFERGTGWDLWGRPLVFGYGESFVSASLTFEVDLPKVEPFSMKERVDKVTFECGAVFCPVAQHRRIMTETSDLAVAAMAQKLMASLTQDSRVRHQSEKRS